jgi:hypothetical protein
VLRKIVLHAEAFRVGPVTQLLAAVWALTEAMTSVISML